MCHLPYAAVVRNLEWCRDAFASAASGNASSWVPLYHDMGLFGGVMWAAIADVRAILMAPLEYVRHPMRWLEQIDQYKVAATLCPSFALHQFNRLLAKGARVDADLLDLASSHRRGRAHLRPRGSQVPDWLGAGRFAAGLVPRLFRPRRDDAARHEQSRWTNHTQPPNVPAE